MTATDILLSDLDHDGVLRLTLNDVARRNALSEAMLGALSTTIAEAGQNPAVRVVILAANGPAFCAGHDLKEMTAGRAGADGGKSYFAKVMAMCSGVMQGIVNCPKPVIAEVTGIATAAGCQLVASCDLAIAADTAKFSTPGVHIGLFCSTPMVALSRNVSAKHAMEMLLTGEMTPAARAAEMGLINRAVPEDMLRETTLEMARKIVSKSSMVLATGKRAFYTQREMTLSEAYDYASRVMVENMLARDAVEGISAFIEKRAPEWQDA
ncbi:enoyl-CoA hydratase [Lentibacter sp. XHP0401]|jgi:enoyl-CoA hydratase/carnithine racemase|uniref:enoyl-CoA hydratase n=1 Tax=Lentibacter sp. XHP0401 TaxID=2984334 RepID=UPI0021E8ED1E|nr:enoyl-CoA hydratase [Lentibacter sp. XHP0401]MCV2894333.1 enoyl-CoA hydratase [Lentibacter sp. XHP0401]